MQRNSTEGSGKTHGGPKRCVLVADDDESSKAETTAALHHLGHAVDRNHLFAKAVVAFVSLNFRLHLCHDEFLP